MFWFRILGWGLCFTLRTKWKPLFSERYGYKKTYCIGPLRIEVLRD